MLLCSAAAVVVLLSGCGDEASEARDIARLEAMEQEIRALVGDAPCADSTDCTAIPLGAKPCGGPWGYLVYSRSSVDSARLATMAREYTEYNAELNQRWGWISTCDLARMPRPACKDGRCVDVLGLYDRGIPP